MERIIKRMSMGLKTVVYEQGESGKWRCPVCGEFSLVRPDTSGYCPVCDAPNDELYADGAVGGVTRIPIDEARRQWKENGRINWEWNDAS